MATDTLEQAHSTAVATSLNGLTPRPSEADVLDALERYKAVFDEIDHLFVGRGSMIEMVAVTVIGGFNMIVFGPPGTAKSAVIRRFAVHIQQPGGGGLTYFSKLVFRSTVPAEIFGAVDMPALEHSVFQYNIKGMLPAVHIFMLDEVYNATSVILNGSMQIMNERVFTMGPNEISTPTIAGFGASNVLPQEKDLAAFHDRWTFRTFVDYLDETNIRALIDRKRGMPAPVHYASLADVQLLMYAARNMVELTRVACDALERVWHALRDAKITVSDRRLEAAKDVLCAAALYRGSFKVGLEDLAVLKDVLWQDDPQTQRPIVERILARIENPMNAQALTIVDEARQIMRDLNAVLLTTRIEKDQMAEIFSAIAKVNTVSEDLDELYAQAEDQGYSTARLDEYVASVKATTDTLLGMVKKVKSVLTPAQRAARKNGGTA